jgi:hypothetical protein
MENRRQLRCNALRQREKRRLAKYNGEQWKKQWKEQYEEQWKQGERLRPVVTPRDRQWPPENQCAPEALGSGRANVTLHLLPCATRGRNASGFESIPAIQGRR